MAPPELDPGSPAPVDGALRRGLTAGPLGIDPLRHGGRRGRARRWAYAAAGDGELALGAAIVSLGPIGTAFAWVARPGGTRVWERKLPAGPGLRVGVLPVAGAHFHRGAARVELVGDGGMRVDVPLKGGGRLRASVSAEPVTPAVLVTDTPRGGWNATEKAAGYRVTGWSEVDGDRRPLVGAGWRDWTAGRQDRHTEWRWAAGAGTGVDGRRVGFNLSTGMNAGSDGEDVVWWDGVPRHLDVTALGPTGRDAAGPWSAAGPGWRLELESWGARAADEDLWLVRSRYVQPVGRFRGTLPGPDGTAVDLGVVTGVAEEHRATW